MRSAIDQSLGTSKSQSLGSAQMNRSPPWISEACAPQCPCSGGKTPMTSTILEAWNDRRRAIARRYLDAFEDLADLELPPRDGLHESAWHQFVLGSPERDALGAGLQERGVQTLVHYEPLPHLTAAYRADGHAPGEFPIAERLASRALSLPMYPHLADAQVEAVIAAVVDVSSPPAR